ncbi:LuxE/PaaK family acyltransferase [Portibacter lacus]|uniref:Acyltransferase n=1 Tax=Portibacter lacus TaxID=1099794 RepID=A0AA37WC93_9BACT|nr:acyl transferase [Portibacter lacus]GLR16286.1 acyltransferase [Portibacter lacus]
MSNYILEREKIVKLFNERFYKADFNAFALEVFRFQHEYNSTYRSFCDLLGINPLQITSPEQAPFLPISFFKNYVIKTGQWKGDVVFGSSGTTGSIRSKHHIRSEEFYLENAKEGFIEAFGPIKDYCFLAILPGYTERPDSSLVSMVNSFIKQSDYAFSGYYLGKETELIEVLNQCKSEGIPTVLFGVSFALLDLCKYQIDFPGLQVIETGGMKTSKIEMSKEEIIAKFRKAWNLDAVGSEYGMTELLSQSYSSNGKWYQSASTKKIYIGELRDPLELEKNHKTGIIKVIDCANFDTCSFIETQDLGILNDRSEFQVLGRMDNAELRGCNLLLDESLEDPVS